MMTNIEKATIAAADHVLNAPEEWLRAEPKECLQEILAVLIDHLQRIHTLGIGMRVVKLKIMQEKYSGQLDLM